MPNLDADERKIALRHIGDALVQLTIAAGADEAGNYPLAVRADAYAVDALESVATALGYRLVPMSARGALADSVNLLAAVREREAS
jgi:hypothetical protein